MIELAIPNTANTLPPLPDLFTKTGIIRADIAEAAANYNDNAWTAYSGSEFFENLGIFNGHAFVRATFNLASPLPNRVSLYVEHAADIVGIYVNSVYITTVLPMGTEIDSDNFFARYQFETLDKYLVVGKNVLVFKVEIHGHGSSMFPRGTLWGTGSLPSVGYDSVKGVFGSVWLSGARSDRCWWDCDWARSISSFKFRTQLGGQLAGWPSLSYSASSDTTGNWSAFTSFPLTLQPGQVVWYRTNIDGGLLDSVVANFSAPLVLRLSGANVRGTIYLNNQIIGRWFSDSQWINQGTWAHAVRNLWSLESPDDFPLLLSYLAPNSSNVLAIAFEDASIGANSRRGKNVGVINFVKLAYNQDLWVRNYNSTKAHAIMQTVGARGKGTVAICVNAFDCSRISIPQNPAPVVYPTEALPVVPPYSNALHRVSLSWMLVPLLALAAVCAVSLSSQ